MAEVGNPVTSKEYSAEDESSTVRMTDVLAKQDCLTAWGFAPGRADWIEGQELPRSGAESETQSWVEPGAKSGAASLGLDIGKTIRLWPHRLRGRATTWRCCKREAPRPQGVRSLYGTERGIPEKDCREYLDFAAETLKEKPQGIYLRFGDQLYLAPVNMPSLKGLHVLRPGLHLGTLKKNRFEPSHALALTLSPKEVRRCCPVSAGDGQTDNMPAAQAYLKGQTFSLPGEKGWYLITVDGYSLGWGKLAGGIMKNHYPKGLRS